MKAIKNLSPHKNCQPFRRINFDLNFLPLSNNNFQNSQYAPDFL